MSISVQQKWLQPRLKIGDKAKIAGNVTFHHFEIGEEVEILAVIRAGYLCLGPNNKRSYCHGSEFEGDQN